MTGSYQTHWLTLSVQDPNEWQLWSDGFIPNGKVSPRDFFKLLRQLSRSGWVLVSSVSHLNANPPRMDLYFRRKQIQPADQTASGEIKPLIQLSR